MKRLFHLSLLLFMSACGKVDMKEKATVMNLELKAPVPAPAENSVSLDAAYNVQSAGKPPAKSVSVPKKIIKEGDISFETGNIREARNSLCNSLFKLGGYVAEEKESNNTDNNRKEYTLNVRIPSKNFDSYLDGVISISKKIDSKNIRRKDVTEEYIDITTQLENKKKLEGRYLQLLTKANKMTDMLEIENKLTDIRTEIESTQGRLNYLEKEVDYSSLEITFYNKQIVPDNGYSFGYRLKSALSDGWLALGGLFFGFLQIWPVWILLVMAAYLVRRWRRKNKVRIGLQASTGAAD